MTALDQRGEGLQQDFDVGEVQAGRRLIEEKKGARAGRGGEVTGEFEALGFATGERGHRLTQLQITEADRTQRFEPAENLPFVSEE